MRVCHIITGLEDGGAEAVLFRLCTAEASIGPIVQHHVISLAGPGRYGPMLTAQGVKVDALDMTPGRLSIAGLASLYRLLKTERPDVVQTWMNHANLVGGIVARLAGIRSLSWGLRHGLVDPASTKMTTRIVDWCSARLSGYLPKTIVGCAQTAMAIHTKAGYAPSKLVVIPNGYQLERFTSDPVSRERIRSSLAVDAGTFLIGMVARWHPVKDHRNLLAALARLTTVPARPWRCVLVGSGMDSGNVALGGLIAELGLEQRVILAGQRTDVHAFMNALDLHVLTSHSEAFPNVVAEAMACGTPCLVTDVGDASYIVGETGWVAPPAMPEPLANAIAAAIDMQSDQSAWTARRLACRARVVENFSLSTMVLEYLRVWSSIREDGT